MKIVSVARRLSLNGAWSHQFHQTHLLRSLSTSSFPANGTSNRETNKSESSENFEQRIFGEIPGSNSKINAFYEKLNRHPNKSESTEEFEQRMFGEIPGSNSKTDAFFEKLNRQGTARDRSMMNDLDESFDTLSDGMDGKLKNAAKYFEYDSEEVEKEDYSFRYDATFWPYSTYDVKDLDLTKPGVRKPKPRNEFQVTTKEVLSQADFRAIGGKENISDRLLTAVSGHFSFCFILATNVPLNVRFLANFLTEAGIIIKRSKTGISAKAQRKVAREIKTARAFGLMPFTTMGTKPFAFGNSMENVDDDFAYQSLDRNARAEPDMEDI